MTKVIYKTGNIWTTKSRAIGHGVNTHGVMGSGIAVQFREKLPDMYAQYRVLCQRGELQPGGVFIYPLGTDNEWLVYNIASQDAPGANASYEWLESGVRTAVQHAEKNGHETVALPRIGAGVGGLDWENVKLILEKVAAESTVDIEAWSLEGAD
jgi:O-acetyl-ADP-ribose deacetylase (regulator of RNase III)